MKYAGQYNGCEIWTDESIPNDEIWGLNFKDWSFTKMKINTTPTFTTPGAAYDWMSEEPSKRSVQPARLQPYRLNCEGLLECLSSISGEWEKAELGAYMAFFRTKSFVGHESRSAEDELSDQCLRIAGAIHDTHRGRLTVPDLHEILTSSFRAIIAARK